MYEYWRQAQLRAGKPLRVPIVGVLRRLRALNRLGWSRRAIAERMGRTESWLSQVTRRTFVSPETAAAVREVYDELSMRLPEASTPTERGAVFRAKTHAERMGWPPPLAWSDDTIDDPEAEPEGALTGMR